MTLFLRYCFLPDQSHLARSFQVDKKLCLSGFKAAKMISPSPAGIHLCQLIKPEAREFTVLPDFGGAVRHLSLFGGALDIAA